MELIITFIDFFIHLDRHLLWLIQHYGFWVYLIVFIVVFCETGLVVTPPPARRFSPVRPRRPRRSGRSLDVLWLFILLAIAAIARDTVNYFIGKYTGPRVFHTDTSRFFKREYLERTLASMKNMVENHRHCALYAYCRTFAPFVAGIGAMTYSRFILYNISGGIAWVAVFIFGGFYFGNIPTVKNNFALVIMTIIFISILPALSSIGARTAAEHLHCNL